MEHIAAGKNGMPTTRDPGRVLRRGDPGFAAATASAEARAPRVCEHPGCKLPTYGHRKDSRWCEEHRKSKYVKARLNGGAEPAPVKPPGVSQPHSSKARATTKPAPSPSAPSAGNGGAAIEIPLNTALLVTLLRAAADQLERKAN